MVTVAGHIRNKYHTCLSHASAVFSISIICALLPDLVRAQDVLTIDKALSLTAANNPQILAEKAKSLATSEGVPIALAAARPSVALSGSYGWQRDTESSPFYPQGQTNPQSEQVTVSQPIYDGRIEPGIKQAKALANADRAELDATEQSVLLSATNAFLEVIRDEDIVRLYLDDISGLNELQASTQKRLGLGELTKTDVAQVAAQLSQAQSGLVSAEQQMQKSKAEFEHIVGVLPENLVPPVLPEVPAIQTEVLKVALSDNPTLRENKAHVAAARQAVKAAAEARMPTVSVQGQFGRTDNEIAPGIRDNGASVIGQISFPLYQGGKVSAAIRQAQDAQAQAENTAAEAERQVREDAFTAWDALQSAQKLKDIAVQSIDSNRAAYVGAQAESKVGTRTVFDILNADQQLLRARISQTSADCDFAEATYRVLNVMGLTKLHN